MNNLKYLYLAFIVIVFFSIYLNLLNLQNSNASRREERLEEAEKIFISEPDQWIINNRIVQYSARIVLFKENLMLETLAQCDYLNQTSEFIKSKVKFIINHRNEEFFMVDIDSIVSKTTNIRVKGQIRNIFLISCLLPNKAQFRANEIYFTLTDFNEYSQLAQIVFKKSFSHLAFHKPNVYNSMNVKEKAIAHCVHMVRNLNKTHRLEKLVNWLDMQKAIGIVRVKLYLYQVDTETARYIQQLNGKFVDVIHIPFEFEKVCRFQIGLDWANPVTKDRLLRECERVHGIYLKNLNWGVQTTLELLVSNDCYASFKYSHEFVSNYDFDEFILPRRLKTNDLNKYNQTDCNRKRLNYGLYDYVSGLTSIFQNKTPIAALRFSQVLFLNEIDLKFFTELGNSSGEIFEYRNGNKTMRFKELTNKEKIHDVEQLQSLVGCLNETIVKKERLNPNFNRPFAIKFKYGGKTVFNTNYTLMINQHSPFEKVKNSSDFFVPYDYGYYNHYRERIEAYFNFTNPIAFERLLLDIDNYIFLANLY